MSAVPELVRLVHEALQCETRPPLGLAATLRRAFLRQRCIREGLERKRPNWTGLFQQLRCIAWFERLLLKARLLQDIIQRAGRDMVTSRALLGGVARANAGSKVQRNTE